MPSTRWPRTSSSHLLPSSRWPSESARTPPSYSFVESILLRPLPVREPESLVTLNWTSPPPEKQDGPREPEVVRLEFQASMSSHFDPRTGAVSAIFPYAAFDQFQRGDSPFQNVFSYMASSFRIAANGSTDAVDGSYVSGSYFTGLGVVPAAGRLIAPDDDSPEAPPMAVLSHRYWTSRFGASTDALGKTIVVNSTPVTIAGVAPPEFFGVDAESNPDLYLPLHSNTAINSGTPMASIRGWYTDPHFYWLEMMARLKPGVTAGQAQAALAQPFHDFILSTAETEKERAVIPSLLLKKAAGGLDTLRRQYSQPLYLLAALVGLMLAIVCANLANLLLARSTARRHEIAVRLSMGAARGRIVRQLLTESVLLSCVGGALGTALAIGGIHFLTALLANGRGDFTLRAHLNGEVLFVSAAISILAGIFFGLAPALRSTRIDLMPALKDARSSPASIRPGRLRVSLGHALIVSQVALSLLLLIAAGLFARTLYGLENIALGFNKENLLLFNVNLREAGVPDAEMTRVFEDLRERLSQAPSVRAASYSNLSLVGGGSMSVGITLPGREQGRAAGLYAGPSFFETMQIRMLEGRSFNSGDRKGEPRVAVVNELFARTFFAGRNAIGQRFIASDGPDPVEIVGVVANSHLTNLKDDPSSAVFLAAAQAGRPSARMTYEVRTDGNPLAQVGTVREIVRQTNGSIPVPRIQTQAAQINRTINQEILFAELCTAFALLALAVACVGLYGVTAYNVARRTNEIGIRMALGARSATIRWMVLRDVFLLVAAGLTIGVPVGLATAKFVGSLLFNVQPRDPVAFTFAAATLLAAALLAAYFPARRASRIDPMTALRHE